MDLDQGAIRRDLLVLRTATQHDIAALRTDVIRHFHVVAEEIKTHVNTLFDVTRAEVTALAVRVDVVEGHGPRIEMLDLRVTRLERPTR